MIKNYIDTTAQFFFVPQDYKWGTDEIPFVLPSAELNPTPNHTTFEILLDKYGIRNPILDQIARIIHDIEQAEDSGIYSLPESRGIFMILRGLEPSSSDDNETVVTAMKVMDSLYTFLLKTSQGEKLS